MVPAVARLLMTSDTKAAESFYRSVLGWDAKDSAMADRSYTLFSAGPMMVGSESLALPARVPRSSTSFRRSEIGDSPVLHSVRARVVTLIVG
jgi:predicted enzyme related to lactoylglutathione lyase